MREKKPRDLTGTFRIVRPFSSFPLHHLLITKDGNVWVLKVDPDRVHWLDGLKVRVQGDGNGGIIKVRSIVQV
jgi:hypothetical protein